jgi:hypothetical protein
VADLEHQNNQTIFFEAANQTVIAHPVAPQTSELHPQRFAENSGILRAGNSFPQITEDGLLNCCVELAQLSPGAVVELDCPCPFGVTF